jgi:hypothetical protein
MLLVRDGQGVFMKLINLYNGTYKLVLDNGTTIEADRVKVSRYMWVDLDIEADEIEFALAEIARLSMDTAHFGVNGTFTHCTNSKVVNNVLAELKAVQSLRRELVEVCAMDPNRVYTNDAGIRLLNLYIALNVDAIVDVIEGKDYTPAA